MAEMMTDSNGHFVLHGYEDETTTIDPKLNIYHDCDDSLPCQRKVTFFIPDSFVSDGRQPKKLFDIGTVNMQIRFENEERDCLH